MTIRSYNQIESNLDYELAMSFFLIFYDFHFNIAVHVLNNAQDLRHFRKLIPVRAVEKNFHCFQ